MVQPPRHGLLPLDENWFGPQFDRMDETATFPWWPNYWAPSVDLTPGHPELHFHTATQLRNGRISLIVDCGAWTNLLGLDLAVQLGLVAQQNGIETTERELPRPLNVSGVGNGSQTCWWELSLPIAVPDGSGGSTMHRLTTPIVEGDEGKRLPGLLGLRSMEQLNAILDTGKRELIIPGPGGVTIEVSAGSIRIPLEKAPSGHFVMQVDAYEQLAPAAAGGVGPRTVDFTSGDYREVAQPPRNVVPRGPRPTGREYMTAARSGNYTGIPVSMQPINQSGFYPPPPLPTEAAVAANRPEGAIEQPPGVTSWISREAEAYRQRHGREPSTALITEWYRSPGIPRSHTPTPE